MSTARKIGIGLAVVHLIAFLCFVGYVDFIGGDAQLRLLWTLWIPVDFPISLLASEGLGLLSSPALRTGLLYVVHGALGTLWWLFLPALVAKAFRALAPGRKGAVERAKAE